MPALNTTEDDADPQNYDIDPSEFEFEREPCRTRDSTNNYTDKLGQIKGTKLWVAYRSWQTPDGMAYAIKGIGRLSMEGVDLEAETAAEAIHDFAERWEGDSDEIDTAMNYLHEHADEIAERLVESWRWGSQEVVDEAIYEGHAGVNGTQAWSSHVDETFTYEAEDAMDVLHAADGYEETEERAEYDVLNQALYAAVQERRDSWLRPHLDYEVNLKFDIGPWELRALELQQNGRLPEKTAHVAALKESGLHNYEIAKKLDIHESTVTRQVKRAKRMINEAEWLVENGPGF